MPLSLSASAPIGAWSLPLAIAALSIAAVGCAPDATPEATRRASASAGSSSDAAPEVGNVVKVVTRDYAFQMPDTIPSGAITFYLHNEGKEPHHLMLYRLDDGKSVRDAFAALQAGGAHPAWMHAMGGPNAVPNGGESIASVVLEPGSYVAFCHVKSRDGRIHFMKGMLKGITVAPPAAMAIAAPAPDITVTLRDYSFEFSKPPTRGKHLIAITNAGSQRHELILSLLQPGKTSRDFITWLDTQNGPPPVTPYGGITDIEPGRTVVIPVELKAGNYSVVCRVRDTGDDAPHDRHGMLMDLAVR
ncbi:MAG TPA: hypothetical protein VFT57_05100 [Gemmatimonadaceae bacterium]|jgi:hypothetical protein|nr:hypothetical protein [Gemmatimonadaceae bacterium]